MEKPEKVAPPALPYYISTVEPELGKPGQTGPNLRNTRSTQTGRPMRVHRIGRILLLPSTVNPSTRNFL
jgi:hypothetical protein